jgi:hypothetical protein
MKQLKLRLAEWFRICVRSANSRGGRLLFCRKRVGGEGDEVGTGRKEAAQSSFAEALIQKLPDKATWERKSASLG